MKTRRSATLAESSGTEETHAAPLSRATSRKERATSKQNPRVELVIEENGEVEIPSSTAGTQSQIIGQEAVDATESVEILPESVDLGPENDVAEPVTNVQEEKEEEEDAAPPSSQPRPVEEEMEDLTDAASDSSFAGEYSYADLAENASDGEGEDEDTIELGEELLDDILADVPTEERELLREFQQASADQDDNTRSSLLRETIEAEKPKAGERIDSLSQDELEKAHQDALSYARLNSEWYTVDKHQIRKLIVEYAFYKKNFSQSRAYGIARYVNAIRVVDRDFMKKETTRSSREPRVTKEVDDPILALESAKAVLKRKRNDADEEDDIPSVPAVRSDGQPQQNQLNPKLTKTQQKKLASKQRKQAKDAKRAENKLKLVTAKVWYKDDNAEAAELDIAPSTSQVGQTEAIQPPKKKARKAKQGPVTSAHFPPSEQSKHTQTDHIMEDAKLDAGVPGDDVKPVFFSSGAPIAVERVQRTETTQVASAKSKKSMNQKQRAEAKAQKQQARKEVKQMDEEQQLQEKLAKSKKLNEARATLEMEPRSIHPRDAIKEIAFNARAAVRAAASEVEETIKQNAQLQKDNPEAKAPGDKKKRNRVRNKNKLHEQIAETSKENHS